MSWRNHWGEIVNTREAFDAWWRADGKFRSKPKENCNAAFVAGAAWAARECAGIVGSVSPENPMTANDCFDAICARFPEAWK